MKNVAVKSSIAAKNYTRKENIWDEADESVDEAVEFEVSFL